LELDLSHYSDMGSQHKQYIQKLNIDPDQVGQQLVFQVSGTGLKVAKISSVQSKGDFKSNFRYDTKMLEEMKTKL